MISIDTETTGTDHWHGARPFFVTITGTDDRGAYTRFWEWRVDPLTRIPQVPEEDLTEIRGLILGVPIDATVESTAEGQPPFLVLQNAKFDVHALCTLIPDLFAHWPWERTHDTLIAGHLLASNQPHDLTSMALHYLGIDIEPLEVEMHKVVEECRRHVRRYFPKWRIAAKGLPEMPSAKEKCWKLDTWLPRALADRLGKGPDHSYYAVLREYANADSAVTPALWRVMEEELHRRDLWEIYTTRMKVVPIIARMERYGLTALPSRLKEMTSQYEGEQERLASLLVGIAKSPPYRYDLRLPKSPMNQSLSEFLLGERYLDLPVIGRSAKTWNPVLDKTVLETYEGMLELKEPGSKRTLFLKTLRKMRKLGTDLTYLHGYQKFSLPHPEYPPDTDVCLLHPSLNPTGTDTLRMSSNNPNAQNIQKGDESGSSDSFSLRHCFGPAPDREWWSLDYENLELRIPGYESGEELLIELFEHPNDPPYFGSYHLAVCDLLHPGEFREHPGKAFKERYASTLYQWVKNGNFAFLYGAQRAKVDATMHVTGAYDKIRNRFSKMAALNDRMMRQAEHYGYVETIPDKTVNPSRGYPVLCTRTEFGKVLSTVPLNYHVQSTAMWCTLKAMLRCQEQLDRWNQEARSGTLGNGEGECGTVYVMKPVNYLSGSSSPLYRMVLQVHDELVFDFPKGGKDNLPKVQVLQRLMEQSGDDIGVPLRVSVNYHPKNWGAKEKL